MEDLRERVEAVERALTDGNGELTALAEGAASADRVEELSSDVASLQEEVAELSAATQALRGYVGNVRSVNEAVEERADAAVAAADSLEERVEQLESDARAPRSEPTDPVRGRNRRGRRGAAETPGSWRRGRARRAVGRLALAGTGGEVTRTCRPTPNPAHAQRRDRRGRGGWARRPARDLR